MSFSFELTKNSSWIETLSYFSRWLAGSQCAGLPWIFVLYKAEGVFVRPTHLGCRGRVEMVRDRSAGWSVWDGDQSSECCASPAAGAGRHTWHCAQATPADVSPVSQLCVYACVPDTDSHPCTVETASCVVTPLLPMAISVSHPFPILLFSLPLPSLWWTRWGFCHHNMIWQNVALHTCHLPGDGGASSAQEDGMVRVVRGMLDNQGREMWEWETWTAFPP